MTTNAQVAAGPLQGRVALVAGATRGTGRAIAVELGRAGATVYCTGRSGEGHRSEMDRPETIEETAQLVARAGGQGIAVRVDHLVPEQVEALVAKIDAEQGRLDILINDIWGGDHLGEWDIPMWKHSLERGTRLLRLAIDTHIITAHHAFPLLTRTPGGLVVELTDGTTDHNATRYRADNVYYDLAKASVNRLAFAWSKELLPYGGTSVAVTPGWIRSEAMLEHFGVTEENWRDGTERDPHFAISESPAYIGRAVASLASDPERARWTGRSLTSAELAEEYGFTDADGSRPDCWRYLVEVQEKGLPADTTGYR
ncbi:NAD(P)-dependent dehydrogenase, short-chain alcohol dehydrogenase family [Sinosporangium album]|uniref:NAD(P)-dependent dehydrogenase, short-chain alcohol dehydrogenase family n=1 Tax=Sinosporangium album TaxID=504805 RepID=A0A1G7WN82_9ACTN|nr:SDR family oxidoreductase [Sinosporangium album]SDG72680.1 NAD(P)-dependent dehydrogenase, short-chain alcohol dehydrogenase family [Sinosporangium album]